MRVSAILASDECCPGESVSMLERRWSPRVHNPLHLPSGCGWRPERDAASGRRAADLPTPFPFVAKVRRRLIPARKLEREPVFEQSRGDNAAALENELGFSTHECRANLEHPIRRRQSERHTVHRAASLLQRIRSACEYADAPRLLRCRCTGQSVGFESHKNGSRWSDSEIFERDAAPKYL